MLIVFHSLLTPLALSWAFYSDPEFVIGGVILLPILIGEFITRKSRQLNQEKEKYSLLLETLPQLVWIANTRGKIEHCNQHWLNYTGLTAEQIFYRDWWAVESHPDDQDDLSLGWQQAIATSRPYTTEYRIQTAQLQYRWVLASISPIHDSKGIITKWIGTAIEIEHHKQIEAERAELLARERIARAEAEAASRAKDEFLAVLSHELRSPLNPILGWAKLLQKGHLDLEQTGQALETIERNAKLQAQLIEDMLDISRILQGKLSMDVSEVDLVTTIKAAIETVHLAATAKSINIQTELDSEVGTVTGDPRRLQQVIWNLLFNAVKFTPANGQVTVRLEQQGTNAQIQVIDTGKGIRADFLPYVFDYFRQEDSSTTRNYGGLGLGLALVRQLVELHGGTVQVESAGEGLGATFTVNIPLMKQASTKVRRTKQTSAVSSLDHIQVLVVDDEADTRKLLAIVLEQVGAKVITAASAAEALEVLNQSLVDVLVSDIGMPKTDGYSLMRQIRARHPEMGGSIPAIARSAYISEKDQ
jgi:PAS domain S-box-containing protein